MARHLTQPPWEFLLSASRNSLQSFEFTRLSHAANLRKEISALLDQWLEENAAAMLARWLMDQRERHPQADRQADTQAAEAMLSTEAALAAEHPRANGRTASHNFFADLPDGALEKRGSV